MDPFPIKSLRCSLAEYSYNHAHDIFLEKFHSDIVRDLNFLVNVFKCSPLYYIAVEYLASCYISGRAASVLPAGIFSLKQLLAITKAYDAKTRQRVTYYQKHLPPAIFQELTRHIQSCAETERFHYLFFSHTEE